MKTSTFYAESRAIEIPPATGGSSSWIPIPESKIAKECTPTAWFWFSGVGPSEAAENLWSEVPITSFQESRLSGVTRHFTNALLQRLVENKTWSGV